MHKMKLHKEKLWKIQWHEHDSWKQQSQTHVLMGDKTLITLWEIIFSIINNRNKIILEYCKVKV